MVIVHTAHVDGFRCVWFVYVCTSVHACAFMDARGQPWEMFFRLTPLCFVVVVLFCLFIEIGSLTEIWH